MKKGNVKTILGATVIAAAFSGKVQATVNQSPNKRESCSAVGSDRAYGQAGTHGQEIKIVLIRDSSNDLAVMGDGSKTEGAGV